MYNNVNQKFKTFANGEIGLNSLMLFGQKSQTIHDYCYSLSMAFIPSFSSLVLVLL